MKLLNIQYYVAEMNNIFSQITQLRRCLFKKKLNSFRYLELEIVLAI